MIIEYFERNLKLGFRTEEVNTIPQVDDYVLLNLENQGVVRTKVVKRVINHTGSTFNGVPHDILQIVVEISWYETSLLTWFKEVV